MQWSVSSHTPTHTHAPVLSLCKVVLGQVGTAVSVIALHSTPIMSHHHQLTTISQPSHNHLKSTACSIPAQDHGVVHHVDLRVLQPHHLVEGRPEHALQRGREVRRAVHVHARIRELQRCTSGCECHAQNRWWLCVCLCVCALKHRQLCWPSVLLTVSSNKKSTGALQPLQNNANAHSQALTHTFATGLRSDTELGVPRVPRVKSNTAVACTTQPPQSPSSVQSREQSARGRCVCDTKSEQQLPTNLQRLVLFQLLLQSRDLSNKNIN